MKAPLGQRTAGGNNNGIRAEDTAAASNTPELTFHRAFPAVDDETPRSSTPLAADPVRQRRS
jgi:hypothetical protein